MPKPEQVFCPLCLHAQGAEAAVGKVRAASAGLVLRTYRCQAGHEFSVSEASLQADLGAGFVDRALNLLRSEMPS
jgi:hypothetical protein